MIYKTSAGTIGGLSALLPGDQTCEPGSPNSIQRGSNQTRNDPSNALCMMPPRCSLCCVRACKNCNGKISLHRRSGRSCLCLNHQGKRGKALQHLA